MLSKHALGYDASSQPSAKRLRSNLQDLTTSNLISGQRAQRLFNDARASGAQSVQDLTGPVSANSKRNLLRKLLKKTKWPAKCMADIPVRNPKTEAMEKMPMHMLLVHEVVDQLFKYNDRG